MDKYNMHTVKYQVISEDKIIRIIQQGKVCQATASDKVKFLYGNKAYFLKVELITDKMFKILKEMGVKG